MYLALFSRSTLGDRRLPRCTMGLVLCSVLGCGSNNRYDISGAVTFDGKPVPLGEIRFEPDVNKGNRGPGAIAEVVGGSYRSNPNMGVVPGPHKVFIRGFDGKGATNGPAGGPAPFVGTPLFPEYVLDVDLQPGSQRLDIDVPKSAAQTTP